MAQGVFGWIINQSDTNSQIEYLLLVADLCAGALLLIRLSLSCIYRVVLRWAGKMLRLIEYVCVLSKN